MVAETKAKELRDERDKAIADRDVIQLEKNKVSCTTRHHLVLSPIKRPALARVDHACIRRLASSGVMRDTGCCRLYQYSP